MIETEKKPIEEILKNFKENDKVFIFGCGDCATLCSTGGENEVDEMAKILEQNKIIITGKAVIPVGCDIRQARLCIRDNKESFEKADKILMLTCGAGAGALSGLTEKEILPGLDSRFLGTTFKIGRYYEYCSTCGKCMLNLTAGLCPVTRCAKGLLNGPCGGGEDGKCEVYSENDCIWVKIYEKLKKLDKLDNITKIQQPKKNKSLVNKPQKTLKR